MRVPIRATRSVIARATIAVAMRVIGRVFRRVAGYYKGC